MVDALEVVDIQHDEAHVVAVCLSPSDQISDLLLEGAVVAEAGEPVCGGLNAGVQQLPVALLQLLVGEAEFLCALFNPSLQGAVELLDLPMLLLQLFVQSPLLLLCPLALADVTHDTQNAKYSSLLHLQR